AAHLADVLAHHPDARVAPHLLGEGVVDRPGVADPLGLDPVGHLGDERPGGGGRGRAHDPASSSAQTPSVMTSGPPFGIASAVSRAPSASSAAAASSASASAA